VDALVQNIPNGFYFRALMFHFFKNFPSLSLFRIYFTSESTFLFAAASQSQFAVQQQAAFISVADVMSGSSCSGFLVEKLCKKYCCFQH